MLIIGTIDHPFSPDFIQDDYLFVRTFLSKKKNDHLIELLSYLNGNNPSDWRISNVEKIDETYDSSGKYRKQNKEVIYRNYKIYVSETRKLDKGTIFTLDNLKTLLIIDKDVELRHKDLNYALFAILADLFMEDLQITDDETELADKLCDILSISKTEFISVLHNKSATIISKFLTSKSYESIKVDEIGKIRNYYEFLNKKGLKYDIEVPISFLNSYNSYRYNNRLPLIGLKLDVGYQSMIECLLFGGYDGQYGKKRKIEGQDTYELNKARIYNYGSVLLIAYRYEFTNSFSGVIDSIDFRELKDYGERVFINTGGRYLYMQKKGQRNPYAISGLNDEAQYSIIKDLIAQMQHGTSTDPSTQNAINPKPVTSEEDKTLSPIKSEQETEALTSKSQKNENYIEELQKLIGLNNVKEQINSLVNYIKVQKMRSEKGLKNTPINLHSVFTGPPGTGKTTVARLYAGILKQLEILKGGQLIEVDRSGLVAGYLGQTALKVDEIVSKALDGILFIDEAYSLTSSENDSYGEEAVDVLLKRMEDKRERLVVILAGYPKEMETFINSNPGLKSRFSRYITFENYSGSELLDIFCQICKENQYSLTEDAFAYLQKYFESTLNSGDKNFGNGRFVRNTFETIMERHSNRIVIIANPSEEDMIKLTIEDVKIAVVKQY